ncbi:B12-binding domain-containing protein [Saccharibacillus sp. JS10]|uniref:B12-binding domain-containing protein n=1 Tax=Saccharibacillus sp. JS10 TaxID=2950552 RepID=UPI00210E6C19|nr:B12-binding domain-containing protein [Saccharibacillus sp. JS10]MCQ4087128.1 B12-binding domain-containing protein [Saccharibacillus sp. JS10]
MSISEKPTFFTEIDTWALTVTEAHYKMEPNLFERYGKAGFEKSKRDTVYTLHYLAESLQMDSPLLFVHYIGWLKQLLAGYGLTDADIRLKLELVLQHIQSEEHQEWTDRAIEILELGITRTREPAQTPSFISEQYRLGKEARLYLDALLRSDRTEAYALIDTLVERGEKVEDIYQYIFQASQYEVGLLWQTQQISVNEETHCGTACR